MLPKHSGDAEYYLVYVLNSDKSAHCFENYFLSGHPYNFLREAFLKNAKKTFEKWIWLKKLIHKYSSEKLCAL